MCGQHGIHTGSQSLFLLKMSHPAVRGKSGMFQTFICPDTVKGSPDIRPWFCGIRPVYRSLVRHDKKRVMGAKLSGFSICCKCALPAYHIVQKIFLTCGRSVCMSGFTDFSAAVSQIQLYGIFSEKFQTLIFGGLCVFYLGILMSAVHSEFPPLHLCIHKIKLYTL